MYSQYLNNMCNMLICEDFKGCGPRLFSNIGLMEGKFNKCQEENKAIHRTLAKNYFQD
jgi:hypothetical protein